MSSCNLDIVLTYKLHFTQQQTITSTATQQIHLAVHAVYQKLAPSVVTCVTLPSSSLIMFLQLPCPLPPLPANLESSLMNLQLKTKN
jgi:hypothetical protein